MEAENPENVAGDGESKSTQPVSVSVRYWMPGDSEDGSPSRQWDSNNAADARIGLPNGFLPAKVRANNSWGLQGAVF
jgi:hypothetical protein